MFTIILLFNNMPMLYSRPHLQTFHTSHFKNPASRLWGFTVLTTDLLDKVDAALLWLNRTWWRFSHRFLFLQWSSPGAGASRFGLTWWGNGIAMGRVLPMEALAVDGQTAPAPTTDADHANHLAEEVGGHLAIAPTNGGDTTMQIRLLWRRIERRKMFQRRRKRWGALMNLR